MMHRWWAATLAAALTIAPTRGVRGQGEEIATAITIAYVVTGGAAVVRLLEPSVPAPLGAEVRVARVSGGEPIRGELAARDSAGITIRSATGDVRIARQDVRRIQLYQGREGKWAQGFALGFAAGAVVGAAGGYLSGDDESEGFLSFTAPEKAVVLGLIGAATGSVLGAIIGLAVRGDHWRRVSRFGVAPAAGPSGGGMNLGLRLRW